MYKVLQFDLGRNALRYLIKAYDIKQIKLPYYLCDVIRHTLVKEGCKPIFYHINDDFLPNEEFKQDDYILYPNYWGVCGVNVSKLSKIYPKLIVDNAHAFYDEPSGFACFNAGHKFGYKESYLWLKQNEDNSITTNTVVINNNNKIQERNNIFFEFHKNYGNTNLLKFDINSVTCPFVYPYLAQTIQEADEFVEFLKEEGKTVYRYWSPLPKSFCEYKFYSRLVPIPVLPLS